MGIYTYADIPQIFVDFKQAYHLSGSRYFTKYWIQNLYLPEKLIRLIRMTMSQSNVEVKTRNQLTRYFDTHPGLKQDDGLTSTRRNPTIASRLNIKIRKLQEFPGAYLNVRQSEKETTTKKIRKQMGGLSGQRKLYIIRFPKL